MPKTRYNAEGLIHKLREADVLLGQGKTVAQACKQIGVTDQTYYRWRKADGGMKADQAKRQVWAYMGASCAWLIRIFSKFGTSQIASVE